MLWMEESPRDYLNPVSAGSGYRYTFSLGFPGGASGEDYLPMRETQDQVQSLGQEDSLEEEMATNSSILAWRIP